MFTLWVGCILSTVLRFLSFRQELLFLPFELYCIVVSGVLYYLYIEKINKYKWGC